MGGKRINCWEVMKCGREPGGCQVSEHGTCPAATDSAFDGFNLGTNAGRICWLVAGPFCNRKVQDSFAEKRSSCRDCDFYKQVHLEEGSTTLSTDTENIAALTHIGLVRKTNEDRYFIRKMDDDSLLMAVADGLGGEVAGDYAAEILRGKLAGILRVAEGKESQELTRLAQETDLYIYNKSENDPSLKGMGTTLICVLLRNGKAHWVHVGDSRLYILQKGQLTQVTEDQTLARFLVEEGEITLEQVPTHYSRHIMDQCLGCGYCEPETGRLEVLSKDLLILTTDGLHKTIPHEIMCSFLIAETNLETKVKSLVQAALDTGGKDNITIVITEI